MSKTYKDFVIETIALFEDELNELSVSTMHGYLNKAHRQATSIATKDPHGDKPKSVTKKWRNRMKGISRAYWKVKDKMHEDVEQVDELSTASKAAYVKKADGDFVSRWRKSVLDKPTKDQERKMKNRKDGVVRAISKMKMDEDVEHVDEVTVAFDTVKRTARDRADAYFSHKNSIPGEDEKHSREKLTRANAKDVQAQALYKASQAKRKAAKHNFIQMAKTARNGGGVARGNMEVKKHHYLPDTNRVNKLVNRVKKGFHKTMDAGE